MTINHGRGACAQRKRVEILRVYAGQQVVRAHAKRESVRLVRETEIFDFCVGCEIVS
jgi:hypothetical protein